MKWIPALKFDPHKHSNNTIKVGDTIKIYGEKVVVKELYFTYNEGLEKWETIILTTRRGDPLERSLGDIEIIAEWESPSAPSDQAGVDQEVVFNLSGGQVDFNSPEIKKELEKVQKEINDVLAGQEVDRSKLHITFRVC